MADQEPSYLAEPISLDEMVNRLNFDSESVQDGVVQPSAINIQDLGERGFSLDRDFVTLEIISCRIEYQKSKKPGVRETPYMSRMLVSDLLAIKDDVMADFIGPIGPLLVIEPSPTCPDDSKAPPQPENPAHCHVLSSRKLGEGGLKKLRVRMLPLLQGLLTVDEFFELIKKH